MNWFDITKKRLKYITVSEIREVMLEAVKQWDAQYNMNDKNVLMVTIKPQLIPFVTDVVRQKLENPKHTNHFITTFKGGSKRIMDVAVRDALLEVGWRNLDIHNNSTKGPFSRM
jgi:predicted nuclease of restriction endonuclease-like RecB superfamily